MENFKLFFSQPPAETSLSAAIYQNILYSDCILIIFQPLIVFSIFSTNLYSLKFANLLRLQSWNLFSPSALNLSDSMSMSELWQRNQVSHSVRSGLEVT